MKASLAQDQQKEIAFFDGHAAEDTYEFFAPESNKRLIEICTCLAGLKPGARVRRPRERFGPSGLIA
jgi:hypothetical protein